MNHATARNHFMRAMLKLAEPVCRLYNIDTEPDRVATDPRFQDALRQLIEEDVKI